MKKLTYLCMVMVLTVCVSNTFAQDTTAPTPQMTPTPQATPMPEVTTPDPTQPTTTTTRPTTTTQPETMQPEMTKPETTKTDAKMNAKTDDKMMSGKKNPDSKFMMTLATGGMNEIGLSQTAVSKSTNEEVKKYAQMMIDDHTKAGEELKTLAASKSVMLPMEMDAKHKAMNEKLSAMSGSDFDKEYVKAMVKDHEKTVALLQKEADKGKDAEAKAFAAQLLPTVQGHLEMAKTMMTGMSGTKAETKTETKMNGM